MSFGLKHDYATTLEIKSIVNVHKYLFYESFLCLEAQNMLLQSGAGSRRRHKISCPSKYFVSRGRLPQVIHRSSV